MHQTNDFSYSHYIDTLKKARKMGYRIIPFSQLKQNLGGSFILIRHDVDFSPDAAVQLARREKEEGLSTTYFFELHSSFYSIFGNETFPIQAVLNLGHDLGYHYDVKFMKFYPSVTEGLKAEIDAMQRFARARVSAYSQHNPSVDGYKPQHVRGCIDAYSLTTKYGIKYLSDSVQSWREGCFCQHLGEHKRMQVLTHPELWTSRGEGREEIFARFRSASERDVQAKYDWLKELHRKYLSSTAAKNAGGRSPGRTQASGPS